MGNYFWCVILVGADDTLIVVSGLHGRLTLVVAFPVELAPGDFNQLIEVQTAREDAENVDQHLEIVQV